MAWLNRKQSTLSRNIANADTPGFQPMRVKEQDFKSLLNRLPGSRDETLRVSLKRTDARHLNDAGESLVGGRLVEEKSKALETTPTGNSVVIEEEMMELTNTQMEYGLMVNLYRKNMSLLRTALGRNSRG